MILELIRKEFKQRNGELYPSKKAYFAQLALKLLFVAVFVTIECYIFLSLDRKITQYSPNGSYDFLVFFLFVFLVGGILVSSSRARYVLFDRYDSRISLYLPIPNSSIIVSKLVYVYLEEALTSFVVATPILICYGATRGMMPYFYIFSCLYPFFITLFSVGISLILVVPYEYGHRLLLKSDVAQLIFGSVLMIALCFLYQLVLELFLSALSDSAVGGVFSSSFITWIHNAAVYMFPTRDFLDILVYRQNVASNVMIILGLTLVSLALGIFVSSASYLHFNRDDVINASKEKKPVKKPLAKSQFQALLKKELDVIVKGSSSIFSYVSLLTMIPFLSYVVIHSLNVIVFSSLAVFTTYFPRLVEAMDLVLLLFFVSIIVGSVSFSLSNEGKGLRIMKTVPVSPTRQLLAKLIIPGSLAFLSLLLTLIVLVATSSISWTVVWLSLLIGSCYIVFFLVEGALLDMRSKGKNGKKLTFLLPILSTLFPIIALLIYVIFVFLALPSYLIYLTIVFFSLALLPISLVGFKKRMNRAFSLMEVN